MRYLSKRFFACFVIIALLVAAFPHAPGIDAAASHNVPEGVYPADYVYYYDNRDSTSAANNFMQVTNSGKVIVASDGSLTFEHEITPVNYNRFQYLGYLKEGGAKAVITEGRPPGVEENYVQIAPRLADNGTGNYVVSLAVDDIHSRIDVLMHVLIPPNDPQYGNMHYDNWYNVQLKIWSNAFPDDPENNDGSEQDEEITLVMLYALLYEAGQAHKLAVEGTGFGEYPAGSRAAFAEKIEQAEQFAAAAGGDPALIQATYNSLQRDLHYFQSLRLSADKDALLALIAEVTEFEKTVQEPGTAEGNWSAPAATITAGEYMKGKKAFLQQLLEAAVNVANNPAATQAEVDGRVSSLASGYADVRSNVYAAAGTIRFHLLDSPEYTDKLSVYNDEIHGVAQLLKTAGGAFAQHANITFPGHLDISEVVQPAHTHVVNHPYGQISTADYAVEARRVPAVSALTDSDRHGYQINFRAAGAPDAGAPDNRLWTGLFYMKYKVSGVEREVYLSFNTELLEALAQAVHAAEALMATAVPAGSDASLYEAAKWQLQAAIDDAKDVSSNLAAHRVEIRDARAGLDAAAAVFKAHVIHEAYYSVVHEEAAEFSRADLYFEKPARIEPLENGGSRVYITVNSSSSIVDFAIRQADNSYKPVDIVANDSTADTRDVAFDVPDTTGLIHAQVRAVAGAYNQLYTVRFNFNDVNNAVLKTVLAEAVSLHSSAVAGSQPGQYPEAAKSAFAAAIARAQAVAVNGYGTQHLTDAAATELAAAIDAFRATVITTDGGPDGPDGPDGPGGPGGPGTPDGPGTPGGPGQPNPNAPVYPADGFYYIPFTVLADGTNKTSVANAYMVSPALVQVTGGTATVSFTVLQSKEITGLSLNGSSGSVVSANAARNTRAVSFSLPDLSSLVEAWVKVDWPELNYHHEYNIQFKFDEAQAQYAGTDPSIRDGSNPGAPNLPNPDAPAGGGAPETELDEEENGADEEGAETPAEEHEAPTVQFSDIAAHWARSSIEQAVKLGIVNGYADGSFRPNAIVTRAEFAVMISRALGLEGEGDGAALQDFASIPGWAQADVARAVAAGIIGGFEDATFRASGHLTRAQLAVIIARAAGLELNAAATLSFNDAAAIPDWAQKEVAAAVQAGLIQGKDGNRFDPHATATRAEALTLIIRLLEFK